jgi:hypothetical protein
MTGVPLQAALIDCHDQPLSSGRLLRAQALVPPPSTPISGLT